MYIGLGWPELEGLGEAQKLDVEEAINLIVDYISDLTPIFIIDRGLYLLSNVDTLSNKTIIFEYGDESKEINLTGPLSMKFLSESLYEHLHMERHLNRLVGRLEEELKEMIDEDFSVELIEYSRYVEFMLRVLRKEFGVDPSRIPLDVDMYVGGKGLEQALILIQREKNRSLQFLHDWRIDRILIPPEGKIYVITKKGLFEYSIIESGDIIRMLGETRKLVKDMRSLARVLLLLAWRGLEVRRVKKLSSMEAQLRSGAMSSDRLLLALTRKLVREKRIEFPVVVEGVRTSIGLRLIKGKVYAFISSGEYVVREVMNKRKFGVFVYFPPVDLCVELGSETREDGSVVIFPVESPVMIDDYLHPSVPSKHGKRTICLGNLRSYVDKIVATSKDVALEGKPKEVPGFKIRISSPEYALKEVLTTAFRIVRYGYVPGANPHNHAVDCTSFKGVRIVKSEEIKELKARGVEIIDPLSRR